MEFNKKPGKETERKQQIKKPKPRKVREMEPGLFPLIFC